MTNDKDFVETANALTKLAILKQHKIEEKAIAIMAKFLLSELKKEDIFRCCSYFAKREKWFPDVSEFMNLVCPAKSLDEVAETEIGGIMKSIKDGAYNRLNFSVTQLDLLDKWNWSMLAQMKQADLDKTRVNMLFYL